VKSAQLAPQLRNSVSRLLKTRREKNKKQLQVWWPSWIWHLSVSPYLHCSVFLLLYWILCVKLWRCFAILYSYPCYSK